MNQIKYGSLIIQYILGACLAFYTYFFYFKLPHTNNYDVALNLTFMSFALIIFISVYYFKGNFNLFLVKQKNIFVILFLWFIATFVIYGLKGIFAGHLTYYSFIIRNFYYLTLIILLVSLVKRNVIENMLVSVYALYFIMGLYQLFKMLEAEKNGLVSPINENVVAFFLLPFLAFILIKLKTKIKWAISWYFMGVFLLYLTNGKTSFIAFMLLPIFIITINLMKNRLRLFYALYILFALLFIFVTFYVVYPSNNGLDDLFNGRLFLWTNYISYLLDSKAMVIGTGEVILPNIEQLNLPPYVNPHNQFISMLFLNGIIGLVFFILFIIISIPRKVNELLPSDAVVFVLITIQFAESIIPFFDFFFLSFIFTINLLINGPLHNNDE